MKINNTIEIIHHCKRFSEYVNKLFAALISQSSDKKIKLVQVDDYTAEDCEINEKFSVASNLSKADEINLLVSENEGSEFISALEDSLERNAIQDEKNILNVNESTQVSQDDYHILCIIFSCLCKENIDFRIICVVSKHKNSAKFPKEDMLVNYKSMHCGKLLMSFKNYLHVEWENKGCASDWCYFADIHQTIILDCRNSETNV